MVSELADSFGVSVTLANQTDSKETPAAAAGKKKSEYQVESVEQKKDPVFQANKNGFKPGAYIEATKKEHVGKIFEIECVTQDFLDIVEVTHADNKKSHRIPIGELYDHWKVSKRTVSEAIKGYSLTSPCSPLQSVAWEVECIKGVINNQLRLAYGKCPDDLAKVSLLQTPTHARAAVSIPAGELKLVPASMRIEKKATAKSLWIGDYILSDATKVTFYLGSQIIPGVDKHGKTQEKPWISQFWFVDVSSKQKEVNMQLEWVKMNDFGCEVNIPFMINSVDLNKGDELKRSMPKSNLDARPLEETASKRRRTE